MLIVLMSTILMIPLAMQWFREANKYLENLQVCNVSQYGTITVIKDKKDDSFVDEFDYIVSNMGY